MNSRSDRPVPRTRKRTWVLLGLGGLLLGLVLWSALARGGLGAGPVPDSPPLPVPNGYDEVLEAGQTIEQSGTTQTKLDLDKADQAALGPIVLANREALARARRGLDQSFQVPVDYRSVDQMTLLVMRDVASIKVGVARAMIAEGRLAVLEGRDDDAFRSYLDLVRLGHAMSHEVPMMAYQMSVAVETTGLHHLRDQREKFSPEQCRQAIRLLEETDEMRARAGDVARRETQFMAANVRRMGIVARISFSVTGVAANQAAQSAAMLDGNEKRQNAARRLLLTDLAIREYRREHGEDPPDLKSLVSKILKAVPIDPYSELPLRYQIRDGRGIVYSLGPDRDDDMLMKNLGQKHLEKTDGDYTIDSF